MMLPCRNCGSFTPVQGGILHRLKVLCDHCKQAAPSGAAVAKPSKPRKPNKRGRRAPAETYLTPEPGDK